jgi:predicted nuclease of predicted toxin-antitoxin system
MKLLIDECLPRALKGMLTGHDCTTVQEAGWSGKKNGELLALAESAFDVLVTIDQGLQHQQNFASRRMALLVLSAPSNQIEDLLPLIPTVLSALQSILPGSAIRVVM